MAVQAAAAQQLLNNYLPRGGVSSITGAAGGNDDLKYILYVGGFVLALIVLAVVAIVVICHMRNKGCCHENFCLCCGGTVYQMHEPGTLNANLIATQNA